MSGCRCVCVSRCAFAGLCVCADVCVCTGVCGCADVRACPDVCAELHVCADACACRCVCTCEGVHVQLQGHTCRHVDVQVCVQVCVHAVWCWCLWCWSWLLWGLWCMCGDAQVHSGAQCMRGDAGMHWGALCEFALHMGMRECVVCMHRHCWECMSAKCACMHRWGCVSAKTCMGQGVHALGHVGVNVCAAQRVCTTAAPTHLSADTLCTHAPLCVCALPLSVHGMRVHREHRALSRVSVCLYVCCRCVQGWAHLQVHTCRVCMHRACAAGLRAAVGHSCMGGVTGNPFRAGFPQSCDVCAPLPGDAWPGLGRELGC